MAKKIKMGAGPKDPGPKMADIARKAANMSNEDMAAHRNIKDDGSKKPKAVAQPNAKKWLDKIKRSEKSRKDFVEDADRFLRMYQGDYSDRPGKKRARAQERMSVNIVYSHVEIVTPTVFSGFPFIRVRPKPKAGESTAAGEVRAKNMELVINYWFKELAVDEELREVFLDTFFGPAMTELGWETEIEEYEEILEDEDGAEERGPTVTVIKDQPFLMRRDFRSVTFDPDARRRRDIRWLAIEEVIPYNDFIASSQYTEKAKKAVKAQLYPMREEDKSWMGRDQEPGDKEWVQIYTIWDKDTRKKFVVTKDYPGYLNTEETEGEEWPYEIEYKSDPFPLCVHDAKRDRMSPYSWSEFKAYEPQIVELNRIRQAIQIHAAKSLPKYIYTDQVGSKDDVAKLMAARSDQAVKLSNLDAIRPLELAKQIMDLYKAEEIAREDLRNVSGLSEYENAAVANTATEAQIMEGRSQVRKTMRSKLWEQFVVENAAKLAMLCQQNMDASVAVEIAGPNGIEWLEVTKEEIQGEFYFDVEPGIMEYKNETLRKQQLLKFMELTNGNPNVNQRGLLAKLAPEFDLQAQDVIVPADQMPPPEPPEPNIKFKDIDPLSINDPALMNLLVVNAMRQNGVDLGQIVDEVVGAKRLTSQDPMQMILAKLQAARTGQQPKPPGQAPSPAGGGAPAPAASGKNMAGNGANPNGNPNLPPVSGNVTETQGAGAAV